MLMNLGQDAIDLGIVITDSDAALGFYRDLLGMDPARVERQEDRAGAALHDKRAGLALLTDQLEDLGDAEVLDVAAQGDGHGYRSLRAASDVATMWNWAASGCMSPFAAASMSRGNSATVRGL